MYLHPRQDDEIIFAVHFYFVRLHCVDNHCMYEKMYVLVFDLQIYHVNLIKSFKSINFCTIP